MPEIIIPKLILLLILTAVLAAATSWIINGLVIPPTGNRGIVFFTPFIEETSKTLWAYGLGASIIWTHLIFGILEGLIEFKRRGIKGLPASGTALVAHGMFGVVTVLTIDKIGIIPSLILAYLVHTAWNMVVVYSSKGIRNS